MTEQKTTPLMTKTSPLKASAIGWFMCLLGALFYCYAYLLRVSPSVMVHQLLSHFHIHADSFGILAASYYYAYTPMQIPVGVIVDRFGARAVLSIAGLICTSGVALFVRANAVSASLCSLFHSSLCSPLFVAEVGRFFIGFGSAFAYVTTLKLATLWLPEKRFATAAGLATGIGMIAAGTSQLLLTNLVQKFGYQASLHIAVIIGAALTIILFLSVRNQPKTPNPDVKIPQTVSFHQLWKHLVNITKNKQVWLIGTVGALLYLPASVFLDLWGIPYLETAYHLSSHQAATITFTIFIGWIIGGPVTGAISDKIGLRRLPLLICAIGATILLGIIFYVPHLPLPWLFGLSGLFGLLCGSHPLCFALSRENIASEAAATAIAYTNFLIMLGGMIFQPVVGLLLDWHWAGGMADGLRVYTPDNFTAALSMIPLGLLLSIFLITRIKETHCRVPS